MLVNLTTVIDQIAKEKSIDRRILIEAVEAAILTAAKKVFGHDRELEAQYNEEIGQVELFQYMSVAEEIENEATEIPIELARTIDPGVEVGDELGFQIFYREEDGDKARAEDQKYGDLLNIQTHRKTFGRIAAQTAKQVIIQRVREAERELVYREYKDRQGEIVTGIARRFERGDIVVDLGRAEAILRRSDQIPRESYRAGDRVQAFVTEVQRVSRGPQIILSRTDPGFVVKLFEMEVPEIYEGIVKIMSVAREAGERTKIAVTSRDSDVDPVGACVGMKGSRVQAVVQELRGEKIDIVPYSPDSARFVCNAIAPAEVSRVLIDEASNTIELIVPDEQLSLAIGRRGQNVRLASQLVGWKIEVNSESKIQTMKDQLKRHLMTIANMDESNIEYLFKLGYHSAANILNADDTDFLNLPGVNAGMVAEIRELARRIDAGELAAEPEDDDEEEAEEPATESPVEDGGDEEQEGDEDEKVTAQNAAQVEQS
ncbi:MAG: transcription termination/antitermination protein NusA [Myxococcales bacterium]|nr:transcription termination/antitermination protein NusA [Myxococcales bacterium]